jgi:signal transduction histidine kinase
MADLSGRGDDRITGEQVALRRVATLVARGAPPEEVFTAVTAEVGRVLSADLTVLSRYDADGAYTTVGQWTSSGTPPTISVGDRVSLGGLNTHMLVFQTGRPARIDDYDAASGESADIARKQGIRSTVGVPISVEGRLWGVMVMTSRREPLPAGTEARLARFTELAATAIANAQARVELRRFAEEQAALRRVATLVARAAPPGEVFTAVNAEVGRVLDVDFSVMGRYDQDGAATILGIWTRTGAPVPVPVDRVGLGGANVTTRVFQTRRPARLDDYSGAFGAAADVGHGWGIRSMVGVPISVEARVWGFVIAASSRQEPLPAGTEARLAGFTELVATALANADAQAALTASRARIVATADATRRRIERDLHDGAQQHLVSLILQLRTARAAVPAGELAQQLDGVAAGLAGVLDELREIASGIHPAILAEGGLRPALRVLGQRCAVPVRLDVQVAGRLPEQAEIAAYYVVAEALTNTAKHAHATAAEVEVAADGGVLRIQVRDDGRGGARIGHGSGLAGLQDRAEALGGWLSLQSPPGAGTILEVALPLDGPIGPGLPPGAGGAPDDVARGQAADPGLPSPGQGT